MAYKYFTYTAHYRKPLTWSKEALKSAVNSYNRLKEIINKLDDNEPINQTYLKKFEEAIQDDLDMPKALAVLWELLRDEQATGKKATIQKMDTVFGLRLLEQENIEIPEKIKKLITEREQARKHKDYKKSDELRKKIEQSGFIIKDTKEGYTIKKK